MDIQKEREAFEAIPEIKDKITSYKMDFVNGSYDSLFSHINAWMDGAWFLFQEKAKAQAVPEWISVNDKLPPANILVLSMSQTPRNIFNIYNVMALDEFEEADVTHWMPLPDAPQEPTND